MRVYFLLYRLVEWLVLVPGCMLSLTDIAQQSIGWVRGFVELHGPGNRTSKPHRTPGGLRGLMRPYAEVGEQLTRMDPPSEKKS